MSSQMIKLINNMRHLDTANSFISLLADIWERQRYIFVRAVHRLPSSVWRKIDTVRDTNRELHARAAVSQRSIARRWNVIVEYAGSYKYNAAL